MNYSINGIDLNLRANRYGEFTSRNADLRLDQTFGSQWVADAEVGYDFTESWKIAIGANNIFDSYSDLVPTTVAIPGGTIAGPNSNGFTQYSNFSPAGFNGGFYYARTTYKW